MEIPPEFPKFPSEISLIGQISVLVWDLEILRNFFGGRIFVFSRFFWGKVRKRNTKVFSEGFTILVLQKFFVFLAGSGFSEYRLRFLRWLFSDVITGAAGVRLGPTRRRPWRPERSRL